MKEENYAIQVGCVEKEIKGKYHNLINNICRHRAMLIK